MDVEQVLDAMAVGVFVCDATGELIAANPTALCMIGATSVAELRSDAPTPFHFPNARLEDGRPMTAENKPMARALKGEEVVHELEILDHHDREKCVLRTRTAPIRDQAGAIIGAVKVAIDVTREHELQRVKEEFVRVAAHELKTPVTVIKANAQAALDGLPDASEPMRRLLEAVNRGADRIDRLVSSLLDMSDLQGGLYRFSRLPVRLDELVDEAVRRLPIRAAARVHITGNSPIEVRCDQRRIRQAVSSLLDNALKYSSKDSAVEVSLDGSDGVALLSIRDRGVGIPVEKQEHVFEKFFRAQADTPGDVGGMGVGLFVAREIVTQHGGRIWFESTERQGTVFHVELPVCGPPARRGQ
jgi:two-component system, OmpR family, sensor histidine kinase VicK